jgi:methylated-DNA-protein-cysteine methyltransferase related protein
MTFKEKIYSLTDHIPMGKVATYSQLARLSGHPKSARAVGVFMRTNPNAPKTPCHRVVAKDGKLTGYSLGSGVKTKKLLLEKEGVTFIENNVDLKKCLWNGVI